MTAVYCGDSSKSLRKIRRRNHLIMMLIIIGIFLGIDTIVVSEVLGTSCSYCRHTATFNSGRRCDICGHQDQSEFGFNRATINDSYDSDFNFYDSYYSEGEDYYGNEFGDFSNGTSVSYNRNQRANRQYDNVFDEVYDKYGLVLGVRFEAPHITSEVNSFNNSFDDFGYSDDYSNTGGYGYNGMNYSSSSGNFFENSSGSMMDSADYYDSDNSYDFDNEGDNFTDQFGGRSDAMDFGDDSDFSDFSSDDYSNFDDSEELGENEEDFSDNEFEESEETEDEESEEETVDEESENEDTMLPAASSIAPLQNTLQQNMLNAQKQKSSAVSQNWFNTYNIHNGMPQGAQRIGGYFVDQENIDMDEESVAAVIIETIEYLKSVGIIREEDIIKMRSGMRIGRCILCTNSGDKKLDYVFPISAQGGRGLCEDHLKAIYSGSISGGNIGKSLGKGLFSALDGNGKGGGIGGALGGIAGSLLGKVLGNDDKDGENSKGASVPMVLNALGQLVPKSTYSDPNAPYGYVRNPDGTLRPATSPQEGLSAGASAAAAKSGGVLGAINNVLNGVVGSSLSPTRGPTGIAGSSTAQSGSLLQSVGSLVGSAISSNQARKNSPQYLQQQQMKQQMKLQQQQMQMQEKERKRQETEAKKQAAAEAKAQKAEERRARREAQRAEKEQRRQERASKKKKKGSG